MSSQGPQEHSQKVNEPAVSRRRSLRNLPGFTAAAVAFVMVLLLGSGGIAIAKWNQSATATIKITAGAAPAPTPTPTSAPTPVPTPSVSPTATPSATVVPTPPAPTPPAPVPEGPGIIVANPVIAKRPALMSPNDIDCDFEGDIDKNTSEFEFEFDKVNNASQYVVTLSASTARNAYSQTLTVSGKKATFRLGRKPADHGDYILRVQPMNGAVAGDPVYRTFRYAGAENYNCYYADPAGRSPLGPLTVSSAPIAAKPNDNRLDLTWKGASAATSYIVSVKSASSSYGTEFTTTSLAETLVFQPRVRDRWGNVTNSGPYFSNYSLRIQPMNGTQAGDPVYKVVQYYANYFSVGEN